MANAIYARPSDNVASAATAAVETGTAATGYPASNLTDLDPAKPAKLNQTSGAWTFDFGSARSIDLVAIIMHNLAAGSNVRIQGNATNAWGGPSLDQAFTIPAYGEDGFPVNPWLDLTALTRSFRWWRLVIVTVQAANVAVGEVLLIATKRSLVHNYADGAEDHDDHPILEHVTAGGVVRAYDIGVRRRRFRGEIGLTSDAGRSAVLSLNRDAHGRAKPFLWIPDPAVNDAWFVRFADPTFGRTMQMVNLNTIPLALEELSSGLVL